MFKHMTARIQGIFEINSHYHYQQTCSYKTPDDLNMVIMERSPLLLILFAEYNHSVNNYCHSLGTEYRNGQRQQELFDEKCEIFH